MAFDALFLTLFFLTWVLLGGLAWMIVSVARRARGALWALPFAWLGGAAGGVSVPLGGLDNGTGVGVSMATAPAAALLLTLAAYWVWDAYDLGRYLERLAVRPSLVPGVTRPAGVELIAADPRPPHAARPASTPPPPSIQSDQPAPQKTADSPPGDDSAATSPPA